MALVLLAWWVSLPFIACPLLLPLMLLNREYGVLAYSQSIRQFRCASMVLVALLVLIGGSILNGFGLCNFSYIQELCSGLQFGRRNPLLSLIPSELRFLVLCLTAF